MNDLTEKKILPEIHIENIITYSLIMGQPSEVFIRIKYTAYTSLIYIYIYIFPHIPY